jgi:LacI family transcriptional regulator
MRPPTIKDVARRAGVSHATVSRVLNNSLSVPIAPATAERIKHAARELNYAPNAGARALALRRTQTIGFICLELRNPFYSALAQAVQARIEAQGYLLIVCSAHREEEKVALYTRLLCESRVDGVLVVGSPEVTERLVRPLRNRQSIPIVATGPPLLPEATDIFTAGVIPDNEGGGFAIGRHLARLGHRRIGSYLAIGDNAHDNSRLRLAGLRAGLAACGVREEVRLVEPVANSLEGGYQAASALLDRYPDLTAIAAYNDDLALAALRALGQRGLRVPEDVSVVGFSDRPISAYTFPALTTVRIPAERIAAAATDLLFQAMAGKPIAQPRVVVGAELVVRESTGPPCAEQM